MHNYFFIVSIFKSKYFLSLIFIMNNNEHMILF